LLKPYRIFLISLGPVFGVKTTIKKLHALVEKLKGEYGVRGAFREVGKQLNERASPIQRRYFDMKKQAHKQGLSLDEIIKKYYLQKFLEDIIKKSHLTKSLKEFSPD
jgi:hypothetical protein